MTGTEALFGPPLTAAHTIRRRVRRELGFTVNVGIAPNRLLAKMASDLKSPTGCIPYINTRSRPRCGRCRWATCSASAPARPSA